MRRNETRENKRNGVQEYALRIMKKKRAPRGVEADVPEESLDACRGPVNSPRIEVLVSAEERARRTGR